MMNQIEVTRTSYDAPDDMEMFSLSSSKRAAICAIMELTNNECAEIERALDLFCGREYGN